MRVVIALIVWIAALAGALGLSSVVSSSIGSPKATAAATVPGGSAGSPSGSLGSSSGGSSGGSGTQTTSAPFDASSVKPTDSQSLFRPTNFALSLAILRKHIGANPRIQLLRLAAGNVIVMYPGGGHDNEAIINADGSGMLENTGPIDPSTQLFPLSKVDAGTPAVLAARIAKFGNSPVSRLDYMVAEIEPITNAFQWLVYPVGGGTVHFEAAGPTSSIHEFSGSSTRTLPG